MNSEDKAQLLGVVFPVADRQKVARHIEVHRMAAEIDDEIGATYVRMVERPVARTVELIDAKVMVDFDADGGVVGIEVLHPSEGHADVRERALRTQLEREVRELPATRNTVSLRGVISILRGES